MLDSHITQLYLDFFWIIRLTGCFGINGVVGSALAASSVDSLVADSPNVESGTTLVNPGGSFELVSVHLLAIVDSESKIYSGFYSDDKDEACVGRIFCCIVSDNLYKKTAYTAIQRMDSQYELEVFYNNKIWV